MTERDSISKKKRKEIINCIGVDDDFVVMLKISLFLLEAYTKVLTGERVSCLGCSWKHTSPEPQAERGRGRRRL